MARETFARSRHQSADNLFSGSADISQQQSTRYKEQLDPFLAVQSNDIGYIRSLLQTAQDQTNSSYPASRWSPRSTFDRFGELLVHSLELDRPEIADLLLVTVGNLVNINCTNDDNSNCLMLAAKKNNIDALEKLLAKQQININAIDMFGWTAIMYACYYGNPECARILLQAGAQGDLYDNDQMTALIWAAGRGQTECVSVLIQLGKVKVNLVDKCGTSALVWASRKGHTEIATLLLKAGANVDSIGMFGWSPLLVAVMGNHIETLKLLLQYKPNVNTCDVHRYTPLIAASKEGHLEMVKLLLKSRAFVNLSDEYGHSALIHAAKGAHLDVVDQLIKHHADLDHCGADKKTALYWAVEKGNLSIVERLLQNKPNLDMVSKEGETCLMRAIKLRKFSIVRVLLQHQARLTITDKNGDTPLHLAVRMQSATLAHLILCSNPKNLQLLHKQNKSKKTPIMLDMDNPNPVLSSLVEIQSSGKKIQYRLFNDKCSIKLGVSNCNLTGSTMDVQGGTLSSQIKPTDGSSSMLNLTNQGHLQNQLSGDSSSCGVSFASQRCSEDFSSSRPRSSLIKKLSTALNIQTTHQTKLKVMV